MAKTPGARRERQPDPGVFFFEVGEVVTSTPLPPPKKKEKKGEIQGDQFRKILKAAENMLKKHTD